MEVSPDRSTDLFWLLLRKQYQGTGRLITAPVTDTADHIESSNPALIAASEACTRSRTPSLQVDHTNIVFYGLFGDMKSIRNLLIIKTFSD